jgi:ATP-dependent exoDNAse (exonuclease V) alpha subunit
MDDINNDKLELTLEQLDIYEQLTDFVKNSTRKELLLVGYAGTGKTTLITKFINDIIKNKLCKKVVIAAPTHKAVNIAKSKLFNNIGEDEELSKKINIMTIHRLLNYQSYISTDNGEKYFAKSSVDPIWNIYNLIFVDECSMLSNQIISDIDEQLANTTNSKVKIIYVGDPAQLPPVNQNDSKIFNKNIKKLVLDKIIRTKNNEIMNLSNDHRKWILSKKNEDIPRINDYICDKIKIYSIQEKQIIKWLDKFIKIINNSTNSIETDKTNDFVNNIILTWTNKKCNKYNQYVREKIFNKKDLDHYEIGEILIFNDFHRIEKIIIEQNNDNNKKEYISFYTSEQIKLVSVEKLKYKVIPLKFKINTNLTTELNSVFKKEYSSINKLIDIEMNAYKMDVTRITDDKISNEEIFTVFSIDPTFEKIFKKLVDEFEIQINKLKKKCFKIINEIKNTDNMKLLILQAEVEKKINNLYKDWQTQVTDKFAQLNYGYSITVHKSQGSTFKNVFIDVSDILDNNNFEETSKCLYTAITRSADSLNLLI